MIKLIAKTGTELEDTFKEMVLQMEKNHNDAMNLIKEYTGVEPKSIGYRWGWGHLATFRVELVQFNKEDYDKIDSKVMRKDKDGYFLPSLKYKKGKELRDRFYSEVSKKCLTATSLDNLGIHTMDEHASYWVQPFYDKESNQYMLLASDGLPHAFGENVNKDDFIIEY